MNEVNSLNGMIGMQWIIFIGIAVVSYIIQANLKHKFKKYSKISMNGMTGRDVAMKMLQDNGIYDVQVTHVQGQLTDHYNPTTKTVNLSEGVYDSDSLMAAAVAAHECGHAVQHARAYAPLTLRSKLVPVVSFASQWMTWLLLLGVLMINSFPQLLLIGIILFATTTIFSFVTLPVEINASRRALSWLSSAGITNSFSQPQAEDALRSAAYTYVVAALGSLATLIYYVMIFMNRRD
jgi:Zn-dependent membrane protease YugP